MESEKTTIEVSKKTRDELRQKENYPKETFDEIIKRLLKGAN